MKNHFLTRVISLVLTVAMFCSLLVLPAGAADTAFDAKLTFTNTDDTKLNASGTLASGTMIRAKLMTNAAVDVTSFDLTFTIDNTKATVAVDTEDELAIGSEISAFAGNMTGNTPAGTDSTVTVLIVNSATTKARSWTTTQALAYFDITLNANVKVSELPDIVQVAKSGTVNGIAGRQTEIHNNDVDYDVTYNVCPYVAAELDSAKTVYDTTTFADFKEMLKLTAFAADGSETTADMDGMSIYLVLDEDHVLEMDNDETLGDTSEHITGYPTLLIRLKDGTTFELEVKYEHNEIESIAVTPPTKTVYEAYDQFDPAGMVVTATYKDGATAVIDNRELTYRDCDAGKLPQLLVSTTEVKFTVGTNYNPESKANGSVTVTVNKRNVKAPSVYKTLTYTGLEQDAPLTTSSYFTKSGTWSATNAGTYYAEASLNDKENLQWKDGTQDDQRVEWKIKMATPELGTVSYDTSKGDIFETTSLETVAANLTKTSGPAGTFALQGPLVAGTRAYTYTFTPADTDNYETATGEVTLEVLENTVTALTQTGTLTKTTYVYGDPFDPTGLTVTATFANGNTQGVTEEVVWSTPTVGSDTVTGTWGGKTVTVTGLTVNKKTVSVPVSGSVVYDGQEHRYNSVMTGLGELGTAYTLATGTDKAAVVGTYYMKFQLKDSDNYKWAGSDSAEALVSWSITQRTVTAPTFEGLQLSYEYDGTNEPTFTLKDGTLTIPKEEYEVTYGNNAGIGTATITITDKAGGNFVVNGSATYQITKKKVTITGVTLAPKVYDGSPNATITGVTLDGVIPGEDVQVTYTGVRAYFNDRDVDKANSVTITDTDKFGLSGSDKDNYELNPKQGWTIPGQKISPREVAITTIRVSDKVYDGTTNATINPYNATFDSALCKYVDGSGNEQTDTLQVSGTATFADKNASDAAKTVTLSNIALTGDRAVNYKLTSAPTTTTAFISRKDLTQSDAYKTATQLKNGPAFADPYIFSPNGETVEGTFTYSFEGKTTKDEIVTALKGKDVGSYDVNFSFVPTDPNYTGRVSGKLVVSVKDIEFKVGGEDATFANVFTAKAGTPTYAGPCSTWETYFTKNEVTATVNGQSVQGTYTVRVDGEANKTGLSAGQHAVTLVFTSSDGSNYSNVEVFSQAGPNLYIAKKTVHIPAGAASGITVRSREYDGNTWANVDMSKTVLNGVFEGDHVQVDYSVASYDTADAGENKTVTVQPQLPQDSNYVLATDSQSILLKGEISKLQIVVNGITVQNKKYDGRKNATLDTSSAALHGYVQTEGPKLQLVSSGAQAEFVDKNVGTGKAVTVTGLTLAGDAAKNYTLRQPTGLTANITEKTLTLGNVTVAPKVYDGKTDAVVTNVSLDGKVDGDNVHAKADAAYTDANASDSPKTANVTNIRLEGTDAENYVLNATTTTATGTILQATPNGTPTFEKITASGKKLNEVVYDLSGILDVDGQTLAGTLTWNDGGDTEVKANQRYGWTFRPADTTNYEVISGAEVLYPVSTGYSEQVKKQAEAFEAKKRGELAEDENSFRDVDEDDYFFDAVQWAVENDITGGLSANRFGPGVDCSRAQVATFLWRASGAPDPERMSTKLADVASSDYFFKAVLWAMEEGVTTGTGAATFSPNATVTRAQVVTFLYRLAGATSDGVHPFTDVAADAYYAKAVAWAYSEGITTGTSATTFSPDAPCTRGQIIAFLYRYFNK